MTMIPKILSKIIFTFGKIFCAFLLVTLLTPLAYFAWRAGQPMSKAEFKGLSYFQFLAERHEGYDVLAQTYQASHPNANVKTGICFGSELAVEITFSWPVSSLYTLAAVSPTVKSHLNPQAIHRGLVPEHVTVWSFLPAWWATFEKMVWGLAEHTPHGPVAYCRLATP
jgi:hypothetical protein